MGFKQVYLPIFMAFGMLLFLPTMLGAQVVLRYAHMNSPTSAAGLQADFFAQKVREYSKGSLIVAVYPSSVMGSLREQAAQVAAGITAINHNTASGIGVLFEDIGVLDTPFLFEDVEHLLRVSDINSPLMSYLNAQLEEKAGVRILYNFYFGSRQLTLDRPLRVPNDLQGLRVRCIPFPVYELAVRALGAEPVPIDWAETRISLQNKVVIGQENPVNTILSEKIYEVQSHLALTNHIMGIEMVIVNLWIWNSLSPAHQDVLRRAAREASEYGSQLIIANEESELARLRELGMTVLGPAEGLDIQAFRKRSEALVSVELRPRWGELYAIIEQLRKTP